MPVRGLFCDFCQGTWKLQHTTNTLLLLPNYDKYSRRMSSLNAQGRPRNPYDREKRHPCGGEKRRWNKLIEHRLELGIRIALPTTRGRGRQREKKRALPSGAEDLKHGCRMKPNWDSSEPIDGQLGELALDALAQATSVLQLVYNVMDCDVCISQGNSWKRGSHHGSQSRSYQIEWGQGRHRRQAREGIIGRQGPAAGGLRRDFPSEVRSSPIGLASA